MAVAEVESPAPHFIDQGKGEDVQIRSIVREAWAETRPSPENSTAASGNSLRSADSTVVAGGTLKQPPIIVVSVASGSEDGLEDSGEDSEEALEGGCHVKNNAARHQLDLSLLQQRGSLQRRSVSRPAPQVDVGSVGKAQVADATSHDDECVQHVVRGLIAESRAVDLDRVGNLQKATKQYSRCARHLAQAMQLADPAHSSDKSRLEQHRKEVRARIKYLRGLELDDRPPPILVEDIIKPMTLEMQVPSIQIVKAGEEMPESPDGDWGEVGAESVGASGAVGRPTLPSKHRAGELANVQGRHNSRDAGGKRPGRRRSSSAATTTAKPRKKHSRASGLQDDNASGTVADAAMPMGARGEANSGPLLSFDAGSRLEALESNDSKRELALDSADGAADAEAFTAARLSADRACLRGSSRRRPKRSDSSSTGHKLRRAHSLAGVVSTGSLQWSLPLPPPAALLAVSAPFEQDAMPSCTASAFSADVLVPTASSIAASSSTANAGPDSTASGSALADMDRGSRSSKRRPSRSDLVGDRQSASKMTNASFARSSPMATSFDFDRLDELFASTDGIEVGKTSDRRGHRRRRASSSAAMGQGQRSSKKQSSPRSSQSTAAPGSDASTANEVLL